MNDRFDEVCETIGGMVLLFFIVSMPITLIAAWIQHLYTCFTEDAWGFLIAGAIFFPVGIVHGVGIWFGFW